MSILDNNLFSHIPYRHRAAEIRYNASGTNYNTNPKNVDQVLIEIGNRLSEPATISNTVSWGYFDIPSGTITSGYLEITDNLNGNSITYNPSSVINNSAVIVQKTNNSALLYDGTFKIFSHKVEVTSNTISGVMLNYVPHISWGDARVWYLYTYYAGLPNNHTIAPVFIQNKVLNEFDSLFMTNQEVSGYVEERISGNYTPLSDFETHEHSIQISGMINSIFYSGNTDIYVKKIEVKSHIKMSGSYIDLETNMENPSWLSGRIFYDNKEGTLSYYNDCPEVIANLGQEHFIKVVNKTGSPITNGQIVYINGAQGNRPTIALAQADTEIKSAHTIGMATHNISDNETGYITTKGLVYGLNTNGFSEGDVIYLSPTVSGEFTKIQPYAPNHYIRVGYITKSHVTDGNVLVDVINGFESYELHDVKSSGAVDKDLLIFNGTTQCFERIQENQLNSGTYTLNTDFNSHNHNTVTSGTVSKWIQTEVSGIYTLNTDFNSHNHNTNTSGTISSWFDNTVTLHAGLNVGSATGAGTGQIFSSSAVATLGSLGLSQDSPIRWFDNALTQGVIRGDIYVNGSGEMRLRTNGTTTAMLLDTSQKAYFANSIYLPTATGLACNTTDGSDNGYIVVCGGGGIGLTRGATQYMFGNEKTGEGGNIQFILGTGDNATQFGKFRILDSTSNTIAEFGNGTSSSDKSTYLYGGLNVGSATGATTGEVRSSSITIGDTVGNITISNSGNLRLNGDATSWDDLRVEPVIKAAGSNDPSLVKFLDNGAGSIGIFLYSFDDAGLSNQKEVYFNIQMPHAWKGTYISPHVHWIPSADQDGAKVVWGLEYSWQNIDGIFPNTTIIYGSGRIGEQNTITKNRHMLSKFNDIYPTASQSGFSSIIMCRLFRDSANTGDTYSGNCGLLYFDLHYEVDSFGSNQEYVKY
jgi:hypothetical protein